MRTYKKIDELARKFDKTYPKDLSGRLQWWSQTLGINRVRLLRMIGLSARQAKERTSEDLKDILKNPHFEAQAQLVEGALHRLVSLFHYDWHTLAERLQAPGGETEQAEPSHGTHRKNAVKGLQNMPNRGASDLLINRLAEGGPEALPTLLAFLAASPAGARPADS